MNFAISKEEVKVLKTLTLAELETYEHDIWETHNTIGQIRVKKMLKDTEEIMEELCFADEKNWYHSSIKTSVLDEYKAIGIFIKEYPPKLMQFINTVYSDAMGMKDVRRRWDMYMLVAINQLRNKGFHKIETPAVAIYRFRTPYERSDADNFTIKILNDSLRDAQFIPDDSFEYLSTYAMGVLDFDNYGTEIYLVPEGEFTNIIQKINEDQRTAII